jgi:predicted 3-demethylubiquinone-9 3-methyltransferase (glyoxalase superfamily)
MQTINPFLWFNDQAEEAVEFYASLFPNSNIDEVARYSKAGPGPEGSVMTMGFRLEGETFAALNGGPVFAFTPATSFFVNCRSEDEVELLWRKLSASGTVLMELAKYPFSPRYGWIQDRFGLSWQLNLGPVPARISPLLMYSGAQAGRAEEAMHLYASLFPRSHIDETSRYLPGEGGKEGSLKHARFSLAGRQFMAMDSFVEHEFGFTPAVSFFISCDTQDEIDRLWEGLSEGGSKGQCGWLEDRFGVSWQVVPAEMGRLMSDSDPARVQRVAEAMFTMTKLDIAALERAAKG